MTNLVESNNPRIGIVQREDGEISVRYDGKQGTVFELLAVLNAKFLLDTTNSPAQYREVFNQLQAEIGKHYNILLLDQTRKKVEGRKDDFDFLD